MYLVSPARILFALLATLALAACGGGGGASSASTAAAGPEAASAYGMSSFWGRERPVPEEGYTAASALLAREGDGTYAGDFLIVNDRGIQPPYHSDGFTLSHTAGTIELAWPSAGGLVSRGPVTADGQLLALWQPSRAGAPNVPGLQLMVPIAPATYERLAGEWAYVAMRHAGGEIASMRGTLRFDAAGDIALTYDANQEGVLTTSGSSTGTYGILGEGSFALSFPGATLRGWMSESGEFAVVGGTTAGVAVPFQMILVRRHAGTTIADVEGDYVRVGLRFDVSEGGFLGFLGTFSNDFAGSGWYEASAENFQGGPVPPGAATVAHRQTIHVDASDVVTFRSGGADRGRGYLSASEQVLIRAGGLVAGSDPSIEVWIRQ